MKQKDKEYLSSKINNEGFEYAFVHYSDYDEIKDEKFHELRKKYLEARHKLWQYLEDDGVEICY